MDEENIGIKKMKTTEIRLECKETRLNYQRKNHHWNLIASFKDKKKALKTMKKEMKDIPTLLEYRVVKITTEIWR